MRPLSFYSSVLKKILTQTYMIPSRTNYLSTEKQAKERTFMALCCNCGNFDDQEIENDFGCFHLGRRPKRRKGYQPDLYYYWDSPIEEDYDWRDAFPDVDCMCEICFDIANFSKKIIWADH